MSQKICLFLSFNTSSSMYKFFIGQILLFWWLNTFLFKQFTRSLASIYFDQTRWLQFKQNTADPRVNEPTFGHCSLSPLAADCLETHFLQNYLNYTELKQGRCFHFILSTENNLSKLSNLIYLTQTPLECETPVHFILYN